MKTIKGALHIDCNMYDENEVKKVLDTSDIVYEVVDNSTIQKPNSIIVRKRCFEARIFVGTICTKRTKK